MLNVIRFLATAAFAAVFTSGWAGVSGAPAGVGHAGHMPEIDAGRIPAPMPGASDVLTKPANPAVESQSPASDPRGAFRITCAFSHFAFDDPLVKPGVPSGSHLHAFVGNSKTDAYTTSQNIRAAGASTCEGGPINQSAYWVPAMIGPDGVPIKPAATLMYYKYDYGLSLGQTIHAPPAGMTMIAGNMHNTALSGPYDFQCQGGGASGANSKAIPDCPAGSQLWMLVYFPQCLQLVNGQPVATSADHKSHVAYPSGGVCPSSHPYAIPKITIIFRYAVERAGITPTWRLSSDHLDARPGTSAHADWMNGWDQDELERAEAMCAGGRLNCHTNLLPPAPGQTAWRLLY